MAYAELAEFEIVIREHRFEPSISLVPAGQRVKLVVHNMDSTPEEFESHELRREKIIAGGSTAIIYFGPLKACEYPFFGEFNAVCMLAWHNMWMAKHARNMVSGLQAVGSRVQSGEQPFDTSARLNT